METSGRRSATRAQPAFAYRAPREEFTLPSEPTPLIGRGDELETIARLLTDSIRLLTLTGPPGIGKSRLALAAARTFQETFRHGAWFVDLTQTEGVSQMDAAMARMLGPLKPGRDVFEEQVKAALQERDLLLVLDNFEHALASAQRVAELLSAYPFLKILVTSREPLRLRWEYRFPVPALAVPDRHDLDPENVARTPAAALFIERAQAVEPRFRLTNRNTRAVVELCQRFNGLPLAIVVAAAHSNALSPSDMLAWLPMRELLSARDAQDAPSRHRSLRDAIEWSYRLLTGNEQLMFRRLAVFRGDWTLEAAEAALELQEGIPAGPRLLASLVDKGLVQAQGHGNGSRRFRMLEVIRAYALERLAAGDETEVACERHAGYYLSLAERAEPHLRGADYNRWLGRLKQEHENLVAALRWAAERGEVEIELRLAGALAYFWLMAGNLAEGREWLEIVLVRSGGAPPRLKAKALAGAGSIAVWQGDYAMARAHLQECAVLAKAHHDAKMVGFALNRLGVVAERQGDVQEALGLHERSVACYRKAGDRWGCGDALRNLGWASLVLGDLRRAETALREALELFRGARRTQAIAYATSTLAELKLQQGDHEGAMALAIEAITLASPDPWTVANASSDRRVLAYVIMVAALVLFHHGHLGHPIRLLGAVDGWSDTRPFLESPEHLRQFAEIESAAEAQLGKRAYHAASVAGRIMPTSELLNVVQTWLGGSREGSAKSGGGSGTTKELLSEREQAVLRLVTEGLSNKQIAHTLRISERTVKMHVTSAMNKLRAENRAHAVALALRRGDL